MPGIKSEKESLLHMTLEEYTEKVREFPQSCYSVRCDEVYEVFDKDQ